MKKKFVLMLLLIMFIIFVAIYFLDNRKGVDQTYLLPSDYEGCVVIYYDMKDAPALEINNNEIVYVVPADGIIYTSSPMDFGWVNTKQSGAFQLEAYYVDKRDKKIKQLSQEQIRFGANGSMQDEHSVQDYYYQLFGSERIGERGCPEIGG